MYVCMLTRVSISIHMSALRWENSFLKSPDPKHISQIDPSCKTQHRIEVFVGLKPVRNFWAKFVYFYLKSPFLRKRCIDVFGVNWTFCSWLAQGRHKCNIFCRLYKCLTFSQITRMEWSLHKGKRFSEFKDQPDENGAYHLLHSIPSRMFLDLVKKCLETEGFSQMVKAFH